MIITIGRGPPVAPPLAALRRLLLLCTRIGKIAGHCALLGEGLAPALTGNVLPQTSDRWLQELKTV